MAKNNVTTDQKRMRRASEVNRQKQTIEEFRSEANVELNNANKRTSTKNRRIKRQPPKGYDDLTFADDFMFGKVMEDKELCREVLECLLQEPVGELTDIQTQREFRYTKDGKPIRLDVCAGNEDIVYDAEMQKLNHRKPEDMDLAKRSRFYQSMMDADLLRKGQSYRKLPDGRVMFICTFDPFKKNLPVYSFMNHCTEDPEIILTDGTEKLYFNCTCQSEDMPQNLRHLYDYITNETVSDELTNKIDNAVNHSKRNEEWRSEYMKELLHDDDVREEALAEGRELGRADGIEIGRADGIRLFIQDKLEDGIAEEVILSKLMKLYSLTKEAAEQYLKD